MSESLDGFRVAATRQNAGSALNALAAPDAPGGVNAPAATSCAVVTDTFGSARAASCSHAVPAACGWIANMAANEIAARQPFRIRMAAPSVSKRREQG